MEILLYLMIYYFAPRGVFYKKVQDPDSPRYIIHKSKQYWRLKKRYDVICAEIERVRLTSSPRLIKLVNLRSTMRRLLREYSK